MQQCVPTACNDNIVYARVTHYLHSGNLATAVVILVVPEDQVSLVLVMLA
ncbi:hypothetical protein Sjap_023947 [Stephania japonica]|uniref:Uncharacterized protein n=1 Tax=Stephania japonica TaxID=461633 RepID=A0AAP0EEM9_9MAGN